MNALEKYLKKIDDSSYDCKDVDTINSEFQQVCAKLYEEGKHLASICASILENAQLRLTELSETSINAPEESDD